MRLRVLAVGKSRKSMLHEATVDYARRIGRYVPFEVIELAASRRPDAREARREEGERILAAHGSGRRLVALDSRGRGLTSEDLATFLGTLMQEGRDVDFVIGGDEGLAETVLTRAETRLSLGAMTLPHQLARLVLLEQLYRAMTILRGEPYHK